MNTITVVSALIALIGGYAIGTLMNTSDVSPEAVRQSGSRHQTMEREVETLAAADYVSMRPAISDLPSEALSEDETAGLLLMREEEKLARDVYQTLYERWGLQIFSNIAQSEQTHTEAVRDLLEKYNIADPVTDDTIGVFTNQTMQELYNDLTAQGSASEVAALTVGATIEDLDIKDLMDLSAKTDNEDIKMVYDNLTRGSRNHLRAFTRQLSQRSETYTPQYISESEYQAIVSGEQESGMGYGGGGMGKGGNNRGWGGRGGGGNGGGMMR